MQALSPTYNLYSTTNARNQIRNKAALEVPKQHHSIMLPHRSIYLNTTCRCFLPAIHFSVSEWEVAHFVLPQCTGLDKSFPLFRSFRFDRGSLNGRTSISILPLLSLPSILILLYNYRLLKNALSTTSLTK